MLNSRRSPRTAPTPLRVAVLSSRRAPGLADLLADPGRGRHWDLVAFVASDPACADLARVRAVPAPAIVHDIRGFYTARGARVTDLGPRAEYDRRTVELLAPLHPDLVVLSGYLHILTAPALEAFPNRIVNIHDADLTVLEAGGRPRYRGLRSTRDAVFAGARETRSTVHLVTPEVDVGPLLVRSWAFPVPGVVEQARDLRSGDVLKAYAYAQREWMMCAAWGPLLARTIELFARGDVRLLDARPVVAGALGPLELPAPPPRAGLLGAVGG